MKKQAEALHIVSRLNREYPETLRNPVSNIALMTAVRKMALSYNNLRDLRWWILNELTVKKSDLRTIPPVKKVFREAESVMLPEGIQVEEEVVFVPLQELLDHTTCR